MQLATRENSDIQDGRSGRRGIPERLQCVPAEIRERSDKQFALLKSDSQHPSLRLKKIGERNGHEIWSARITLKYRVLAIRLPDEFLWFWIGEHSAYDQRIS